MKQGQADTSGGRWSAAKSHAVRPGTERANSKMFPNQRRGTALCGADVFVFQELEFQPEHRTACKRCAAAVAKLDAEA